MAAVLLLLGLFGFASPDGDPRAAAYEAVLRSVGAEYSTGELYLVNLPMERYTGGEQRASSRGLMHDRGWTERMVKHGVVSGSCTPPVNELACAPPDSLAGRPAVSVVFRPIEESGRERAKIAVTLALPPTRPEVASVEKREYTLVRTVGSRWRIVSHKVVGVS